MPKISKLLLTVYIIFNSFFIANAEIVKKIEINGNKRISDETIKMFSTIKIDQNLEIYELNDLIRRLYSTNYFKNIKTKLNKNILTIDVVENPIIGNITYNGIKAKKIKKAIQNNLKLKPRSSFSDFSLEQDKKQILSNLRNLGYYFVKLDVFIDELENDILDVTYKIDIGNKAKINKISFTGNKIFKDSKLKSIIVSEEYKPWKFISGKKYLNENIINLDVKLIKNFYLNKGYHDVVINSTFAKLINKDEFELIFNIEPNTKIYFDKLSLIIPTEFEKNNYKKIYKTFSKIKNKPYSITRIEEILETIDNISINDQFQSTEATVTETIIGNKINLKFLIEETDKIYVQKINILGNNVTRENVLRNKFELDEGDPFNKILLSKSINNIKSLNFFKTVKSSVRDGDAPDVKIIDIVVEEKATGEIMAGAGMGSSGGTISFGIKENNYLGKGISLDTNLTLREDSIKGLFSVTNPNFRNSDKSLYTTVQSSELNKLTDFGYKSNKTGLKLGTKFEYLDDLFLGLGFQSFYEKIETDSSASARQKSQEGNYFDNHLNIQFNYDKRNQKFKTTDGFKSLYSVSLPVVSETNTLTNTFSYNKYTELFEKNVIKTSFFFQSANSITGDDVKLSERLNIPSSKLRGFEYGKIGPKDGNDFVGGNFISSFNVSSTIPQILENIQSTEFIVFLDIANVWGVDYNSTLENNDNFRSSIGIGLDWYSAIGPLNFSLSQPLSKDNNDITESFRFNLGTTF